MFAAAVLVKLSAVTAAPTLVVLLALEASAAGGAWPRRPRGAAVLVAVLAILYARDLRGIWDGAFGYHLDTTAINGARGRHQLANFFDTSGHTVFLWFTVAGDRCVGAVWRRVWFLWLWPVCAVAFVLTYQPLRDNHLILIPYAFAVPVAVALGLRGQRLRRGRSSRPCAVAARSARRRVVQQLHRVDLFREPENPSLVEAAARLEALARPGRVVVVDQPIVAFLADRRVPPQLVDTANSRFESGSLTSPRVRSRGRRPAATAAVAGRASSTGRRYGGLLRDALRETARSGRRSDLLARHAGKDRGRYCGRDPRHRRRRLPRLAPRRAAAQATATTSSSPRRSDYDLTARDDAARLFADADPELVFHLAAEVGGIGANRANPGRYWYANLVMGAHVLEQSRLTGVRKLVVAGTVCAYPKFTPVPFREDDLWNGYPEETNAPYGVAKKALLVGAQAYREQYGLDAIFLLPANLYGPRDNFDLETSHVIPALIRKMLEATDEVVLWGDGTPTREFLYVDDCAEGFVLAAERYDGAEPVNLGTGVEISIRELAEPIAELTGFEGEIVWDSSMPNGQPRRRSTSPGAEQLRLPRADAAARRARADGCLVPRAGACGSLAARSRRFRPSQRPWCSSSCNCSLRPGSGTARGGTERRETAPSPPCCSRSRWCSSMRSPQLRVARPDRRRRSSQASSSSRGRS